MSGVHAAIPPFAREKCARLKTAESQWDWDTLNAPLPDLIEAKRIHWGHRQCGCFSDKALPTNDDSIFGSLL